MYSFLKKLNFILTILASLIAVVLVFTPLIVIPAVERLSPNLDTQTKETKGLIYASEFALNQPLLPEEKAKLEPVPAINALVIPKIGVNGEIHEGSNPKVLEKGIWRRPNTSTPDKGGNTVFVAHRFLFTYGPNTFYSLDKVSIGEPLIVFWNQREFVYEITEIKVVEATDVSIESSTSSPILTLYTCTPLWTSEKRLVVIAKLKPEYAKNLS